MTRPIAASLVFAALLLGLAVGAGSAVAASGADHAPLDSDTSVASADAVTVGDSAVDTATSSAGSAAATSSTSIATTTSSASFARAQDDENDDVVHEHPDSAEDATDVDLAEWFAEYFQSSIEDSAVALEDEQYETGQAAFDEEYEQRLEQYSQIAPHTDRATSNASDPRTRDEIAVSEIEAVRERQTDLAEHLLEYDAAVSNYEAARDDGDEDAALEHAREVVAASEAVQQDVGTLRERYDRLADVTGRDFSTAESAIREAASRTRSSADDVADDAFSDTTLVIESGDHTVSADEPIQIEGRLQDDDGQPIEGATIAVSDPVEPASADVGGALSGSATIGSGATTTVETDSEGRFELSHRAVFLPQSTDQLVVEYRPDELAPHRAARTSVGVDVEQIDGDVVVNGVPDAVQYGDDVSVEAVLTADGDGVAGVPLRLTVGGETVAGATDDDGTLSLSTSVPRDLQPGEQSIRVEVPVDGWSVSFEPQTHTVDVSAADVRISADSAAADGDGILVGGTVETARGVPVTGAPITIAAGEGGRIERASSDGSDADGLEGGPITVRTDENGQYRATLDEATSTADDVVVNYSEPSTNLNEAETTTPLSASSGGLPSSVLGLLTHPFVLIGVALLVVFVVGVVDWGSWRGPDEPMPEREVDDAADEEGIEFDDDAVEDGRQDPLAVAAGQVPDDPSTATVLAYGVGRSALDDEIDVSPDATHREFFAACKADGLDPETVAAVDTLTSRYEEAAFAPGEVDEATARAAINAARELR